MNYARIYAEFINDRKSKQPQKPDYFEKHHIVPRSLGGGNEAENLIRLTPEDHLFAHLLLAKVHGGRMWNAVYAMCYLLNSGTKAGRVFGNRPMFGYMRRKVAQYHSVIFRGPLGPQADKTEYELRHFDGRVAIGNRFVLEQITGVTRQQISAVLKGAKKSAHGWYTKTHNPLGKTGCELTADVIRDSEIYALYHYDGREWEGTRKQFEESFGGKLGFSKRRNSCLGWHREKEDAASYTEKRLAKNKKATDSRGCISGENNPNADKSKYRFVVLETGKVVEATKIEAKMLFGVKSSDLCALFNGRQYKTKGIALAKEEIMR